MLKVKYEELLEAGVHFGHLTRKWDPHMAQYIFMNRNDIHIIDLNRTMEMLDSASEAIKQIARSGRKILFVATKKQAKDIVAREVRRCGMPCVTERWLGGMLTNFSTVRRSVKKLSALEKMQTDGTFESLNKKERLTVLRERNKMAKVLEGISDLTRPPAALFVVDIKREYIAVAEAKKLNIPVFAMVDTNCNPEEVDYPIPGNDDAASSIQIITRAIVDAVAEGLEERKQMKEAAPKETSAESRSVGVES